MMYQLGDKCRQYAKCGVADCKKYFYAEELTMDHVDPWSKGGRTELSNAELRCRPCNIKKGNRI
jgi:5-methylcytosine-specific restriction endonuclease McrA